MTILVTGVAGFIGSQVTRALLARGETVIGIDNFNAYYPASLKRDRIKALCEVHKRFKCIDGDFGAEGALATLLPGQSVNRIIHLGAQAGVRYSIEAPFAYARSNLVGHLEVLEFARARHVRHLVYASSSSVYGGNSKLPFSVDDRVEHPVSLYAATKRADELMSESYAHLYRFAQTGLRFFTVYGPWGRPDMAPWMFTDAILNGRPLRLFNQGNVRRDFTYIDDIVAGVVAALDHPPLDDGNQKPGGSKGPHAIYNLGNENAEPVVRLVEAIELACARKAVVELVAMQPGDVEGTQADIGATRRDLGFSPRTGLISGIQQFVEWFRHYHGI